MQLIICEQEIMQLHQKILRAGEEIIICEQDLSTILFSLNQYIAFLENRTVSLNCVDTVYNLGLRVLSEGRLETLRRYKCLLIDGCDKNGIRE